MSVDLESRLALEEDEPAVIAFLREHTGRVITNAEQPELRWLELRPASAAQERYVVQLTWTAYPHQPPFVTFVAEPGGPVGVARAWPEIGGYRAPNDICMPFTAEGLALHPEWSTGPDAWTPIPNPYLRVASQLQDDLDIRYQGRAG